MFPTEKITNFAEEFEAIREYAPNGTDIWRASNLMKLLGYTKWERFYNTVIKSMNNFSGIVENLASQNGINLRNNFPAPGSCYFDTTNHYLQTVKISKRAHGASVELPDYYLTRLACYAVAMEADNRKPEVVIAKQYLLVLANKGVEDYLQYANNVQRSNMRDELSNYENSLESTYAQHNVPSSKYGYVKSAGDKGFYFNLGGTKAVKEELGIANNKTLYDYMPFETMINKAMANMKTKYSIINKDLSGAEECASEAFAQNYNQRQEMKTMTGYYPEETMPDENIIAVRKDIKLVNQGCINSALVSQLPDNVDPRAYSLEFIYAGFKYSLAQWCYINGIDPNFILNLIDNGISFERAIFMRPDNIKSPIIITTIPQD